MGQFQHWLTKVRSSGWLNKYTVALSVFLVWMMFFDKHNMIVQFQLHAKADRLQQQIEHDRAKLEAARAELEIIEKHQEEYARRKYRMHKPDEDVFVVKRK